MIIRTAIPPAMTNPTIKSAITTLEKSLSEPGVCGGTFAPKSSARSNSAANKTILCVSLGLSILD